MSPRSFYKLLIVTLAALSAAITVWVLTPEYSTGSFFGEPLLPDMMNRINEVDVISIEHEGKSLTFLKSNGDDWSLMEANGYPADKERIRNMLIGLAHLEKIEPKTSLPEFYPDLQVESTSADNSKSYLLTLLNKEGEQITSLLVGKKINGITWNGSGYFIRFPNEEQSWLVRGNFDVTGKRQSWMATRILPLYQGRIGTVTVVDGAQKREGVYTRTDPALPLLPSFTSDKYVITSVDFTKRMEEVLTSFDFESVSRRTAALAQAKPFSSLMIETLDGMNIFLFLYLEDSIPYAAVSFSASEKASDEVREEVLRLEETHNKWLYRIPADRISPLIPFLSVPKDVKNPVKASSAPAKKTSKQADTKKDNKKSSSKAQEASKTKDVKKDAVKTQNKTAEKKTDVKERNVKKDGEKVSVPAEENKARTNEEKKASAVMEKDVKTESETKTDSGKTDASEQNVKNGDAGQKKTTDKKKEQEIKIKEEKLPSSSEPVKTDDPAPNETDQMIQTVAAV